MREIKTQADLNTLMTDLDAGTVIPEKITIYPLDNNAQYQITRPIKITKSNMFIEGINNPQIKLTTTTAFNDWTNGSVIVVQGTSDTVVIENIYIKGLYLIGSFNYGSCGIYANFVGLCNTTGLTSGTARFNNNTVAGNGSVCKTGITISSCTFDSIRYHGIMLEKAHNCNIHNNLIGASSSLRCQGNGIYCNVSYTNTFMNNTLQFNSGTGISLVGGGNHKVVGNISQNNYNVGIYMSSSSANTITSNLVQNNAVHGITVSSSNYNTITNNTISNTQYSINVDTSSYNIISSNIMYNSTSPNIYTTNSERNAIVGNTVVNSQGDGITLNASNYTTVSSNIIKGNGGIGLSLTSGNYCIAHCNILNSNVTSWSISGTNITTTNNKII